jgi:peptide deformylase
MSVAVTLRELKSKKFQQFLDALAEICVQNKGAGIAAPQVGVNKRIIVVYVDPYNPRYPGRDAFPLTIVLNPRIIHEDHIMAEDWEGDLSSNLRALVARARACVVVGLDRYGKHIRFVLDGFHARVFQHEIDHLNGVFLIDRVKHKETISELSEWEKYWKGKVETTSQLSIKRSIRKCKNLKSS